MRIKLLTGSVLTGVAATLIVASPVFACHPQGVIQKQVQDLTSNSSVADANNVESALIVKTGDILNYIVTVSNNATSAKNNDNDMTNTVVTDNLPAGVDLTSDASQRTVTFNLGNIKPGETVTKTINVNVTSNTDGTVIENKACFTSKAIDYKTSQNGCDIAIVKVSVPPVPVTPPATVTPAPTPPAVIPATTLVNTGSGNVLLFALPVAILGYFGSLFVQSKRRATS